MGIEDLRQRAENVSISTSFRTITVPTIVADLLDAYNERQNRVALAETFDDPERNKNVIEATHILVLLPLALRNYAISQRGASRRRRR